MADEFGPGSLAVFLGAHGVFLGVLLVRGLLGRFAGV